MFLTGLAWAVEQGFDVINLSLGTGKRDWALPFYEICDKAYFRGRCWSPRPTTWPGPATPRSTRR